MDEGPFDPGLSAYAILVAAGVLVLVLASLRSAVADLRSGDAHRPPRMDGPLAAGAVVFTFFYAAAALSYLAVPSATPEAVGVKSAIPPAGAFALGFSLHAALFALFHVGGPFCRRPMTHLRQSIRANRAFLPRECRLLPAVLFALAVFKGVLVHLAGNQSGWWSAAIAFGLLSTVVLRASQGRAVLPWHLVFFALSTGLLLSPAGLLGTLGLHYAGAWIPLLWVRRDLHTLRRLRAERTYSTTPSLRSGQ
jgi:hypothetical protein